MNARWGAVLVFAALTLSPVAAGADERKTVPSHIEAVRSFLVAWGHQRWNEVRDVAADSVTVTFADKTVTVDPAAGKSDVAVVLPFRGLSTVRGGAEVTGVAVDELALRVGDQELRGPATVTVKADAGQFRVVGVAVNGAR